MVMSCLSSFCSSLGFPYSSAGKESALNLGDLGWIPELGRAHGEGKGYPLQYSAFFCMNKTKFYSITIVIKNSNSFYITLIINFLYFLHIYKQRIY